MDNSSIREIFEAFFEKYKKSEGDMTVWSAHWTVYTTGHSFEINLTRADLETRFRIFCNGSKMTELYGWEAFLESLDRLETAPGSIFEREDFFTQMAEML